MYKYNVAFLLKNEHYHTASVSAINTFILLGRIRLIKSDSKDIYNVIWTFSSSNTVSRNFTKKN